MKKIYKVLTAMILCFCFVMILGVSVGCSKSNDDDKASANVESVSDMYGFMGMTTGAFLSNNQGNFSTGFVKNASIGETTNQGQSLVGVIDRYIEMFDGVVGGLNPVGAKLQESDDENYKTKMLVSKTDMTGKTITCTMYFNEKTLDDTTVKNPNDNENVATTVSGKIVFKNADNKEFNFDFTGKKEVENGEVEVEFAVVKDIYKIVCELETENGEQEFNYAIYAGSVLIEEFSFDLEVEDNKIELEITTEIANVESKLTIQQYTKKDKYSDKQNICYKVNYMLGTISLSMDIEVINKGTSTAYLYTMPGGITMEKSR